MSNLIQELQNITIDELVELTTIGEETKISIDDVLHVDTENLKFHLKSGVEASCSQETMASYFEKRAKLSLLRNNIDEMKLKEELEIVLNKRIDAKLEEVRKSMVETIDSKIDILIHNIERSHESMTNAIRNSTREHEAVLKRLNSFDDIDLSGSIERIDKISKVFESVLK